MSGFVVGHKHINTLISYASRQVAPPIQVRLSDGTTLYFSNQGDLQAAAEILLAENIRSVQERYPDTRNDFSNMPGIIAEGGQPIIFQFESKKTPIEIIVACNCYDYQACETNDYNETDAHKIVDYIRDAAIRNLPGYDEAEWEIT